MSAGWLIEPGDDEPPGAMQTMMLRGGAFSRGWKNVSIGYRAGYQLVDEACVAPGAPPHKIVAAQPYGAYACDCGVTYANSQPLTWVAANPAQGQYALDGAGGYLTSAQDAGANLLLNYGYVPLDLANCAIEWAADRYRYRERIAMTSKSLGGQETTAFRISAMPEFVAMALRGLLSRRLKLWSDVAGADQPALFVTEHGETVAYGSESLPGKTVLNVDLFVYIAAGKDPDCIPARDLNVALDALQSCLAPGPAEDRQTLGGLVVHCRIEGRIVKDPGDLDGQGLALVPVKILAP